MGGAGLGGRSGFFYGWVVVGAVFIVLTFASGLGFYNATVYLQALVEERGFSIGAASGATAVFFVVFGLAGIPIARLLGRWDPRWVLVSGALVGGVALLLLGRVRELWQVYAAFALFGCGFAAASFVPGTTLVTRWFRRRRALALSVATTGLSVGGVVITPASAAFIGREGLAVASPWLAGLFVLGIAPVALLLVRPDPAAMGLRPDGADGPDAEETGGASGVTLREAVGTPFFAAVTLGFALLLLTQVGGLAHLFPLATEGVGAGAAATAVSTVAFASIVGRFAGAWVLGRVSPMRFAVVVAVVQAAAIAVLALASSGVVLLAGAALFGATVGNVLILAPIVLVSAFGTRDYASIYSVNQLLTTVGIAAGPVLVGVLRDATSGYAAPLLISAGVSLLAAGALALASPPDNTTQRRKDP